LFAAALDSNPTLETGGRGYTYFYRHGMAETLSGNFEVAHTYFSIAHKKVNGFEDGQKSWNEKIDVLHNLATLEVLLDRFDAAADTHRCVDRL
jgi:hypothetical protein